MTYVPKYLYTESVMLTTYMTKQQGRNGKFSRGGAPTRPEGPSIREVQELGCPLLLGKKIFDFWTSLDAFLDHFL